MSQPPGLPGSAPQGPGGPPPWGQQPNPGPMPGPIAGPMPGPSDPGWQSAPTQNFPVPPTEPPDRDPAERKKTGLLVGAAVLALVLVVAGVLLFRNYQTRVTEERAAAAARQAEQQRQAELTRQEVAAQGAAQGFLTALAESDADRALSYAAAPPEGTNELLTRGVLLEANKRAALTAITVDEPSLTESTPGNWSEGIVKARYSIGDQPQTVDLPLRKVGSDWKLDQVAAPVGLGPTGPERLVNGVKVRPGDYNLFPGSYSVTSTNALVDLSTTEFVLASPVDPSTDWEPDVVLSTEGNEQALEASKRAVDECLKSKELAPPSCPFIRWAEDGLTVDKNTIRYTLLNDPWQDVEFQFLGGTLTATTTVTVTNRVEAQATRDGRRGNLVPQEQSLPAYISVEVGEGTPQVSFS